MFDPSNVCLDTQDLFLMTRVTVMTARMPMTAPMLIRSCYVASIVGTFGCRIRIVDDTYVFSGIEVTEQVAVVVLDVVEDVLEEFVGVDVPGDYGILQTLPIGAIEDRCARLRKVVLFKIPGKS